ncbi:MAG: ABC transporter permease [Acidimicrobiales bacterium]
MRAVLREMRRAPVRIATSIVAIALAIAAIGVFAVPGVAENSLRNIAAEDRLTHINLTTTPFDDPELVADLARMPGIENVEVRTSGTVELASGDDVLVVGTRPHSTIDRVRIEAGRYPRSPNEAVVSPDMASIGDELIVAGAGRGDALTVVGVGQTTWLATDDAIFTLPTTARQLTGIDGVNTVVARLDDPTADNLDLAVDEIRGRLATGGVSLTTFPVTLPDGAHPIEDDLTQVSFMIGSLGIMAGIVALILLASTTNAVVTERTRDAAIMRAIGGSRRVVRRDLRRLAMAIGVIGTIIGLPLGLAVANYVARLVLERFAGISPSIGIDPIVLGASVVFGIVGARIVSGRAARRVAKADLTAALRDREASPFGARWSDRLLTRIPTGGLASRIALRALARRRGRGIAVTAQFAGAVAAAVLVASLGSSIAGFNEAELASHRWDTETTPADPLYPYQLDESVGEGTEVAIHTFGEIDDWEIELFGVMPDTEMIDTAVVAGSWLETPGQGDSGDASPAVLAERFAVQEGHAIGDELIVELADGPASYRVVGFHPIRSVALFVAADDLADDLGTGGAGNTVWAVDGAEVPHDDNLVTTTISQQDLFAEDAASRDVIVAVFGAIGTIVVAISALGVASTVSMSLYERRAEFAAMQASGARRRNVRRMVAIELGALALVGWVVGSVLGGLGASAIMDFFATANAVELGFTLAVAAVPVAGLAVGALVLVLSVTAARQSQRRPLEATLRAAT